MKVTAIEMMIQTLKCNNKQFFCALPGPTPKSAKLWPNAAMGTNPNLQENLINSTNVDAMICKGDQCRYKVHINSKENINNIIFKCAVRTDNLFAKENGNDFIKYIRELTQYQHLYSTVNNTKIATDDDIRNSVQWKHPLNQCRQTRKSSCCKIMTFFIVEDLNKVCLNPMCTHIPIKTDNFCSHCGWYLDGDNKVDDDDDTKYNRSNKKMMMMLQNIIDQIKR